MSRRITIEITDQDIDEAVADLRKQWMSHNRYCPIARVLQRETGRNFRVDGFSVYEMPSLQGATLTQKARLFVHRFDNWCGGTARRRPKPTRLQLVIPA